MPAEYVANSDITARRIEELDSTALAGQSDTDCLLTKKELAQRLKKSVRSIENWMKLRYLPYIKIGHSVLFRWRDVVEALDHFHVR
jgi:hypothetical protein